MHDDEQPICLFSLYRWAGTTPEQFREHYLTRHAPNIGRQIPGVAWYHVYLNTEPQSGPLGAPRPDAFAVMCFESKAALRDAPASDKWSEAMEDFHGFVSHCDNYTVDLVRFDTAAEQKSARN